LTAICQRFLNLVVNDGLSVLPGLVRVPLNVGLVQQPRTAVVDDDAKAAATHDLARFAQSIKLAQSGALEHLTIPYTFANRLSTLSSPHRVKHVNS
jgi:hypothetical protein